VEFLYAGKSRDWVPAALGGYRLRAAGKKGRLSFAVYLVVSRDQVVWEVCRVVAGTANCKGVLGSRHATDAGALLEYLPSRNG
jgi:hypothetical protein